MTLSFKLSSPSECKVQAYHALVQPILEYTCQLWNPHTQQSIKQLESVQLGARWICGAHFNPSTFQVIGHHPRVIILFIYCFI